MMMTDENQLNGTIPTELGLLTSVTVMDLSFNILHGTVPTNLAGLVNLGTLCFALLLFLIQSIVFRHDLADTSCYVQKPFI
jgi:hypothetical protein